MNIAVSQVETTTYATGYFKSVEVNCEGKSVLVMLYRDGVVRVTYRNASHLTFRGIGRMFPNFSAAKAAYKMPEIIAAITAAETEFLGVPA